MRTHLGPSFMTEGGRRVSKGLLYRNYGNTHSSPDP